MDIFDINTSDPMFWLFGLMFLVVWAFLSILIKVLRDGF